MKRKFILVLSFLMFVSTSLTGFTNADKFSNMTINESTSKEIQQVAIGYFSNFLEVQKRLEMVENQYISQSSNLKEYVNLHSKLSIELYEKTVGQIDWYSVKVKINSINKDKDIIRVDLDNIVELKYKNTDFDSSYIENHILYLTDLNNELKIVDDIFDPTVKASLIEEEINTSLKTFKNTINNKNIENKIKDLNNKIDNLDNYILSNKPEKNIDEVTKNSETLSNIPMARVTYDPWKAANWALDNVYSTPDYGADCTNFVSKAIRQGGLPTDSVWYLHSNAWIRVIELRNWLLNKGYATQYRNITYARVGDLVQYYSPSYGNWRHSVIVTGKDNWSDYPYVSAHSSPKKNILSSYYYPNGSFTDFRVLDVYGKK